MFEQVDLDFQEIEEQEEKLISQLCEYIATRNKKKLIETSEKLKKAYIKEIRTRNKMTSYQSYTNIYFNFRNIEERTILNKETLKKIKRIKKNNKIILAQLQKEGN